VESGDYRSRIAPRAVLATLQALEARYDVPVVWCDTPAAAALIIESWAYWYARELCQDLNRIAKAHRPA
jgi:hypothetical protein